MTDIMPSNMTGHELARIRVQAGASQRAVAAVLGVSQRTVSDWERGHYRPRPEKAGQWQDACVQAAGQRLSGGPARRRTTVDSAWLVRVRKEAGASRAGLAVALGVASKTIRNWETGRHAAPADMAERWAAACAEAARLACQAGRTESGRSMKPHPVIAAAAETLDEAVRGILCGAGLPRHTVVPGSPSSRAVIYRWLCPICDGTGYWSLVTRERCPHCQGYGLTNNVAGWDENELKPAPRPPAVMRAPCVDCAYRPGSPENPATADGPGPRRPNASTPFFCHHGMHRLPDGGYESPAYVGSVPLGAMVCASWWALALDEELPDSWLAPFRDPGGADRTEAAPEVAGG